MELHYELMVFTLFVCLGAGIFAVQGLLAFRGKGKGLQMPALVCSLVSVAIGGIGSFLHLQHWERIFNGFGNLTSGITQELVAIVVFMIAFVVYFIVMRRSEDGKMPPWCGAMALVIGVLVVFIMAHSYNMAARPVWDTPLLWLYYLANASFFGALAVALIAGAKGDESAGFAVNIAFISGIVSAAATAAYAAFFTMAAGAFTDVGLYFDPTHPTKAMADSTAGFSSVFIGENALLFWLGVVVVGLIVPLALAFLAKKKEPKTIAVYSGAGLVCALVGGMCFRAILYILGFSVFMFY